MTDRCELCPNPAVESDILCRLCRIKFAVRDPVMERTAADAIARNLKAGGKLKRIMEGRK